MIRHGIHPSLQHPGLGTVPAHADRRAARRHAGAGLPGPPLSLPTRRACRLARDLFLDVTGDAAAILPRIVAIGDLDEDEIAFAQAATGAVAVDALELPPTLGPLERRMLLTQLVLKWAQRIAPAV